MAAERLGVDVCGGGTWEVVAERWANIYGVAANITNGRVEGLRDACNDLVDESEHATSEKCGDGARNTSACEVGGSNVTLPSKSTDRSTGPLLASLLRELDGARSSGRGVEFGVKALSGLSDILKVTQAKQHG